MRNPTDWRIALLLAVLLGPAGCSSGGGGERDAGVSGDLLQFAEDFAETVCSLAIDCGCADDWTKATCTLRVSEAAWKFFTDEWRDGERFEGDCAQAALSAIEAYGCDMHLIPHEHIGLGDGCGDYCSLHRGEVPAGGACRHADFYLYPVSDCQPGLVCDLSGTCVDACDAWYSDKLPEGGQCEDGFLKLGDCAEGLGCETSGSDLCVRLPGEGQTCLYNLCAPGLFCEVIVATRTCRPLRSDGERCTKAEACWSGQCTGNACVGGQPPEAAVCAYIRHILDEPWSCRSDADCDDANPCTIDGCEGGACQNAAGEAGLACDDGQFCNGEDSCDGEGHCAVHLGDPCAEGGVCNQNCNESTRDCFDPQGATCDDGDFCNGEDSCDGAGVCLAGPGRDCSDADDCTFDFCDRVRGYCRHIPQGEGLGYTATCAGGVDDDCDGLTDSDDPGCQACGPGSDITPGTWGFYFYEVEHQRPGSLAYYESDDGLTVSGVDCPVPVHIEGGGQPEFELLWYGNWATDGFAMNGENIRVRARAPDQEGASHEVLLTVGDTTLTWNLSSCSGPTCMVGEVGKNIGCSHDELRVERWQCPGSDEWILAREFTYQFGGTGLMGCPAGATCQWENCGGNGWEVGTLSCPP